MVVFWNGGFLIKEVRCGLGYTLTPKMDFYQYNSTAAEGKGKNGVQTGDKRVTKFSSR